MLEGEVIWQKHEVHTRNCLPRVPAVEHGLHSDVAQIMALGENWCTTTRSGLSRTFEMLRYVSGLWLSYEHWFRAKCLNAQLYLRSWLWYVKPMFSKLFQLSEHLDVTVFPAKQQENNFLVIRNGIHISLLTQNTNMLSHCVMDSAGQHTFFL